MQARTAVADASAREVARERSSDPILAGTDAATVGEWRRIARGLTASMDREILDAHRRWHARNPIVPIPEAQIRGAVARGRARFSRAFPEDRIADTIRARAEATTRATRRVQAQHLEGPALKMPLDGVVDRSVRSGQKLAASMARDYGQQLKALAREGLTPAELEAALRDRHDVLESRADLIGVTEAHHVNVEATKAIHRRAGVESYIWGETSSENPRADHLARVGDVFRWDDPPEGGHPGSEPNCACVAIPLPPEDDEDGEP